MSSSGVVGQAARLLPSWGFDGFGHSVELAAWKSSGGDLPAVMTLPLAAWKAGIRQGVLEDSFEAAAGQACNSMAAWIKDNPNVIGVFCEDAGSLAPRDLLLAYAALDPGTASKRALVDHIRERCGNSDQKLHSRMPSMRDFNDLLEESEWPDS